MAEIPDGIDLIRSRMQRGQRTPPAARRPQAAASPAVAPAETTPGAVPAPRTTRTSPPAARSPRRSPPPPAVQGRAPLASDAATANLALRVRRPLDDHLADLVHGFRREGVRTSKVELVELLLWELPETHTELRARLGAFRRAAARGSDAPLVEDPAGP